MNQRFRKPVDGAAANAATVLALVAAWAVGIYLRSRGWHEQVLLDDEWHLIHQLVMATPSELFLNFGFSDYSIPLGLTYAWLGRQTVLSETWLRLPMLVCGFLTLIAGSLVVARRAGWTLGALSAWLLAVSPILILYSQMARPYAITLPLVWVAAFCMERFVAANDRRWWTAAVAVGAGVLAIWLHLAAACFVVAPWILSAWRIFTHAEQRQARAVRTAIVAGATMTLGAFLVLPPLLANPTALSLKSGWDSPTLDTAIGAWHLWTGTDSPVVALTALVVAAFGAPALFRRIPETRAVALGSILAFGLLVLTRPMGSHNAITLARYLLPVVPLILVAIALGCLRLLSVVQAYLPRSFAGPLPTATVIVAGLAFGTHSLADQASPASRYALHMQNYFDLREAHNPFQQRLAEIPVSGFWSSLGRYPAQSLRIAIAPFYFESFNLDTLRWEAQSRQVLLPGFLSGLCVGWRWGEVPQRGEFHLRNAVWLADQRSLDEAGIDLVAWQRPYRRGVDIIGEDTAHCETALAQRFGNPIYEDAHLAVFAANPKAHSILR